VLTRWRCAGACADCIAIACPSKGLFPDVFTDGLLYTNGGYLQYCNQENPELYPLQCSSDQYVTTTFPSAGKVTKYAGIAKSPLNGHTAVARTAAEITFVLQRVPRVSALVPHIALVGQSVRSNKAHCIACSSYGASTRSDIQLCVSQYHSYLLRCGRVFTKMGHIPIS
jgi:hypothetical protein